MAVLIGSQEEWHCVFAAVLLGFCSEPKKPETHHATVDLMLTAYVVRNDGAEDGTPNRASRMRTD